MPPISWPAPCARSAPTCRSPPPIGVASSTGAPSKPRPIKAAGTCSSPGRTAIPSAIRSRWPATRPPARRPGSAAMPRTRSCATSGRLRAACRKNSRLPANCRTTPGISYRTSGSGSGCSRPHAAKTCRACWRYPAWCRSGMRRRREASGPEVIGPAARGALAGASKAGAIERHAGLHHPSPALDPARHGSGRRVHLLAAASVARRSGRDHRRRQRHPGADRGDQVQSWPQRPATPAIRALGPARAQRRSRHLDLFERAGGDADCPARLADGLACLHHHRARGFAGPGRGRAGGLEGRQLARSLGDDPVRRRVLRAGVLLGYLLIYVFAIGLRWLPVQGYAPLTEGFWPWASHLVLPSLALGLAYVALIARITRTAMLDVLAEDYMRTARAKGVATGPMLFKHALKSAGVPIVTVVGTGIVLLLGGG